VWTWQSVTGCCGNVQHQLAPDLITFLGQTDNFCVGRAFWNELINKMWWYQDIHSCGYTSAVCQKQVMPWSSNSGMWLKTYSDKPIIDVTTHSPRSSLLSCFFLLLSLYHHDQLPFLLHDQGTLSSPIYLIQHFSEWCPPALYLLSLYLKHLTMGLLQFLHHQSTLSIQRQSHTSHWYYFMGRCYYSVVIVMADDHFLYWQWSV
jgi:hypothetical protein